MSCTSKRPIYSRSFSAVCGLWGLCCLLKSYISRLTLEHFPQQHAGCPLESRSLRSLSVSLPAKWNPLSADGAVWLSTLSPPLCDACFPSDSAPPYVNTKWRQAVLSRAWLQPKGKGKAAETGSCCHQHMARCGSCGVLFHCFREPYCIARIYKGCSVGLFLKHSLS